METETKETKEKQSWLSKSKHWSEIILFIGPKVVLVFFYFIAFIALIAYGYSNTREFIHSFSEMLNQHSSIALLIFLEILDALMIANLGQMLISGSYNSFVSKDHGFPEEGGSAGVLKVKMSTTMMNVIAIGLVKAGVLVATELSWLMHLGHIAEPPPVIGWGQLLKLGFIYFLLMVGSKALADIDHLHGEHELEHAKFKKSK